MTVNVSRFTCGQYWWQRINLENITSLNLDDIKKCVHIRNDSSLFCINGLHRFNQTFFKNCKWLFILKLCYLFILWNGFRTNKMVYSVLKMVLWHDGLVMGEWLATLATAVSRETCPWDSRLEAGISFSNSLLIGICPPCMEGDMLSCLYPGVSTIQNVPSWIIFDRNPFFAVNESTGSNFCTCYDHITGESPGTNHAQNYTMIILRVCSIYHYI